MSVNSMSFNDASALLNEVRKQMTGETAIAPINEEEFVKVGTTLLQTGYDQLNTAISQVIARTVWAVRNYGSQFPGLIRDEIKWGGIVRKITEIDGDFEPDLGMDATAMENGKTLDPFKINRKTQVQFNFYGGTTLEYCDTLTEDQMDQCMSSSAEFGSYMAAHMQALNNQFVEKRDAETQLTLLNLIGAVVTDGTNCIHLLTEYKADTGNTTITRANLFSDAEFVPFAKWMYSRLNTLINRMGVRSAKYHIPVTTYNGKALLHPIKRFTPRINLSVYMLDSFMQKINASVLSSVYNKELLTVGDYNSVKFWQAIDAPDSIDVTPNVLQSDGTVIKAAKAVTSSDVIGVFFDEEAAGVTTFNEGVRPQYNARGRYYNNWYNWKIRSMNDQSENAIVLMLD